MSSDAASKLDASQTPAGRRREAPASAVRADRDPQRSSGATGRGPSWAPHLPFAQKAHARFGNRIVGAALRGEVVDGPASVIHTVMALGTAGVHVGDSYFDVVPNSRMGMVLGESAGVAGTWGADSSEQAAPGSGISLAARLSRRAGRGGEEGAAAQPVQQALQSGGRPLPAQVRADLECRFGGVSFANVRIHTDGRAARAADAVNAEAFTVGQEIWFSRGSFSPETRTGLHLLTHELTHVLQNRQSEMISGGTEVGGVAVAAPSDAREREAEAVAHEVSRVEAAPEVHGPGDALSQLASRWSVEINHLAGVSDVGVAGDAAEAVLASGGPATDAGAVTAQRQKPPGGGDQTGGDEKVRYKTLADGSKVKIEGDGSGNWFLRGPGGEKVPCNEDADSGHPRALGRCPLPSRPPSAGCTQLSPTPNPQAAPLGGGVIILISAGVRGSVLLVEAVDDSAGDRPTLGVSAGPAPDTQPHPMTVLEMRWLHSATCRWFAGPVQYRPRPPWPLPSRCARRPSQAPRRCLRKSMMPSETAFST